MGLTDNFSNDAHKQTQWLAFLRKNRLEALALNDVVAALATFFAPVIKAANANTAFSDRWQAGGPWLPTDEG